jgi:predicted phage tail protein
VGIGEEQSHGEEEAVVEEYELRLFLFDFLGCTSSTENNRRA